MENSCISPSDNDEGSGDVATAGEVASSDPDGSSPGMEESGDVGSNDDEGSVSGNGDFARELEKESSNRDILKFALEADVFVFLSKGEAFLPHCVCRYSTPCDH